MRLALGVLLTFITVQSAHANFESDANSIADSQLKMDQSALEIAYATDFQKKINPGLYPTRASQSIMELFNNAQYVLDNAKQTSSFSLASYLCFVEPSTDGCEQFNGLGCEASAECESFSNRVGNDLTALCTTIVGSAKTISDDCFIISLRASADDGSSRNSVTPWNDAVQDWIDAHNCTALMYHLKYRCHATLIKWSIVTAKEEYVDLDQLFDATFGMSAVANFNGEEPVECATLTENDRTTLKDTALLHVQAAILHFTTTAAHLATFGLSAMDAIPGVSGTQHAQDKLRTMMLLNVFYDGAVQPLREWCCAANMCYDYHPMEVVVDKTQAVNSFYPGGLLGLASHAEKFAKAPSIGAMHASTGVSISASDAYVFNVLAQSPGKTAWQAAASAPLTPIESF